MPFGRRPRTKAEDRGVVISSKMGKYGQVLGAGAGDGVCGYCARFDS